MEFFFSLRQIFCFLSYCPLTIVAKYYNIIYLGLTNEISALQVVLRDSVGSYRLLLGTNVAALKYMNREINQKKQEKMVGYDLSFFDSSGSNAGLNITKIDDGASQKRKKEKDNKKKRKSVINVGNGNAVKKAKS